MFYIVFVFYILCLRVLVSFSTLNTKKNQKIKRRNKTWGIWVKKKKPFTESSVGHLVKYKCIEHWRALIFPAPIVMVKQSLNREMFQCFVLQAFKHLYPLTRGRWEVAWALPSGLARDQVQVEESRCGRTSQQYCSRVTVSRSQTEHTGLFRCRYRHRTRKQTSIYVYVTGKTLLPEVRGYNSHFFSVFPSSCALSHREAPQSFTPSCLLFISPG